MPLFCTPIMLMVRYSLLVSGTRTISIILLKLSLQEHSHLRVFTILVDQLLPEVRVYHNI